jgi:hypothetical protein
MLWMQRLPNPGQPSREKVVAAKGIWLDEDCSTDEDLRMGLCSIETMQQPIGTGNATRVSGPPLADLPAGVSINEA